ncbi:MAG: AMP-binding protein [Candidatus Marinimicrobia bacterium]|nr:AMP-binding protein [Candidatus Neomarinimicrobiota bacterium]
MGKANKLESPKTVKKAVKTKKKQNKTESKSNRKTLSAKKPWLKQYHKRVPEEITTRDESLYEAIRRAAYNHPKITAWEFLGEKCNFKTFLKEVEQCADAFWARGIRKSDRVTICLPNVPQAVITFYALNKIGAIVSEIHPLSTSDEIEYFMNISKSKWAITLDAFYGRFASVMPKIEAETLLLTKIPDYLSDVKSGFFNMTTGRKIPKVPSDDPYVLWWQDFIDTKTQPSPEVEMDPDEMAVILYSGGTTGRSKGIMLTSRNFNALGEQMVLQLDDEFKPGLVILAILPVFHGFGLGICIHTVLMHGGTSRLVPKFDGDIVVKQIQKNCPNIIAGVPTLYEAMLRNKRLHKADLSNLIGVFVGADKMPKPVRDKFNKVLKQGGSKAKIREGYGLTETVTGNTLIPSDNDRDGSVGVPISSMFVKIVEPNTINEIAPGEDGEICVSGPTMMLGYLDEPGETAEVLKEHEDGKTWLHTGDMGYMDKDGFLYFRLRIKRMVKVSGMGVFPPEIEHCIDSHPSVKFSCAIGVPDPYKINVIKAFIVTEDNVEPGPELADEIKDYCKEKINNWSCPQYIEFRKELPQTKVGKIAYIQLEAEELAKWKEDGDFSKQVEDDIIKSGQEGLKRLEKMQKK